jgi:ubiquinone/menaquinone biosynthesis C-methylase UbiE
MNKFLDIACAIGSGTVAAKLRWPKAEVYGIELAGPLVRYAHMRATRLNSEVHFSQQLAEKLDFADNTFDLIYMSTLLHEMPLDETVLIMQTLDEIRKQIGLKYDYER